ncbi:MAG: hypothetical protein HY574_12825 [candidate division NC10 bacterium]|nr:hypothetical protein [candidate division NC10 bacterium]
MRRSTASAGIHDDRRLHGALPSRAIPDTGSSGRSADEHDEIGAGANRRSGRDHEAEGGHLRVQSSHPKGKDVDACR